MSQWTLLGWALVVAAPGVADGRGVGAVALAVLEQFPEEVVESLREVHHPGEVEVGVLLGEGGAYVVAEWLECAMVTGAEDCTDVQCHAPLPEARVADGVLEGRLTVLNALSPVTYELVVKGEQVVWRPWRAGEEAFQVAAQPGEGRRCAAAEGAEDVHDASALGGTGGQPVEPPAVPGVVEAPAVEEIQLVVEAFEHIVQQAEQSVRVAGVEQASRIPPLAVFAALLRQPGEGVAQCGQRGEKDLGALLTFFIGERLPGVGGDVRRCELGGELCEPLHQAVQHGGRGLGEALRSQVTQRVGEAAEQGLESVVEGILSSNVFKQRIK
ncbi:glyoxal reductase, putative [Babesia ovata]|uniref:Glyoxal reductase, putative n=1 Tax=Babesia ovata TaxID=189622 RepID=A0A2H6KG21_9APIC|nr:glyoxal reductase, putative [Babesia ovata]GBE61909.1 glyoxal reductase, putative [Babesia ovata]